MNSHADPSFRETFEGQYTYINGFLRNVRRCGNRPALYDVQSDREWTYGALNAEVNRLAHALQKAGLAKGQVVMYLLYNSVEFVLCYLAPQKLGAVNCPINYRQAPGELALNIDDSRPAVFVYDSSLKVEVNQALEMAGHKPAHVLMVNNSGEVAPPAGQDFFDVFLAGQPDTEPEPDKPLSIYDETTRFYTSGTTSRPNGVSIYSINEVLSAHDVVMEFSMRPMDRTMNLTPWFHRGGLHSCGPCPTLYIGGEAVILRDIVTARCLKLTEQLQVTFLIGVPSIFSVLCRMQERNPVDLSSLRGIVTMGSPLDRSLCQRIMSIMTPNVYNGYGTTESFWNTVLHPYDLPEMAGSVGRACTDDDVRVVKSYPDRRAEPDDLAARDGRENGEIIISSVAKTPLRYADNPELTEKKFYKGFLYTGDLGTWDRNAFITISGRKDDMIVTSGENVHAAQVEEILNEHPKVLESCVVGIPDDLRGQVPVAYIVAEDESLTVREIREFADNHPMLSDYKRPKYYHLCSALPHTATGKLQHNLVRVQARKDMGAGLFSPENL